MASVDLCAGEIPQRLIICLKQMGDFSGVIPPSREVTSVADGVVFFLHFD